MSNEPNAQIRPNENGDAELDPVQSELNKVRDDLLRALAEVENTRKRAERQAADARAYAIDRFAGDLLAVADTLSRALAAAPRNNGDEAVRNLIAGIEMTERALLDAFSRNGLRRVGAPGEAFDPRFHQAVGQAPGNHPAGAVLEVMQPGYVLSERTLRAAMVMVSTGPGGAAANVDIKV